ncbi:MAG: hypothetical protein ACT4P4_21490 [Betaproteobacteria bacterium]
MRALWIGFLIWLLAGPALAADTPRVPELTRTSATAAAEIHVDCGKRPDMGSCEVRCLAPTVSAANATNRFSAPIFRDVPCMAAPSVADVIRAPQHAPPKLLQG